MSSVSDYGQINSRHLRRAFVTNQATKGSFTAKIITRTKPSGDGVVDMFESTGIEEGSITQFLNIFPFGIGADNDAFVLRVWGWSRIKQGQTTPADDQWFPRVLATITCTLSTFVGLAGASAKGILNTERFADTVALVATTGEAKITADTTNGGTCEFYSPADDTPGFLNFQTRGIELLEFDQKASVNTPTANALVQLL